MTGMERKRWQTPALVPGPARNALLVGSRSRQVEMRGNEPTYLNIFKQARVKFIVQFVPKYYPIVRTPHPDFI
jgi:hypothetical protein